MSLKLKLEKKIKEKEIEINNLEKALMEARAYLQGTQDALRLLTKTDGDKKEKKSNLVTVRPGTILDQVRQILKRMNKPMSIMDILVSMGKEQSHENRQALVGSIGAYARKGAVFAKTGPNTFGLLEWENGKSDEEKNELPDDFGLL